MRGNPIFRIITLIVVLCLTGALVAAVVRNRATPPPPVVSAPDPEAGPNHIPTYFTVTLSAPATSITMRPASGPGITIPGGEELTIEHEGHLVLPNGTFHSTIEVAWKDTSKPTFLHLELEPDGLPTREVTVYFNGPTALLRINFTN